MSVLDTNRPMSGPVGSTFNAGAPFAQNFLKTIDTHFDQNEGWTTIEGNTWTWYTGKLAVTTSVLRSELPFEEFGEYAHTEIVLAEGMTEISPECYHLLNNLNAHAAGWIAWIDPDHGNVKISIRTALAATHWWWQTIFLGCLPLALAVADANSETFAGYIGGTVARRIHPKRGERIQLDTWIDGVRLGPREPTASLDLMLTSKDFADMRAATEKLFPQANISMGSPLHLALQDSNGTTYSQLRSHWHSNLGRGWQYTSIESGIQTRMLSSEAPSLEDLQLVTSRNIHLMRTTTWMTIMGGWVAVRDFGFVRQMFIPAHAIEAVVLDGTTTFGAIAAFMYAMFETLYTRDEENVETNGEAPSAHNDLFNNEMNLLNMKTGPLAWSFFLSPEEQPFFGDWDREDNELAIRLEWSIPRHILVCSFGIFNPVGPTVSSLEIGSDGTSWNLYFVLRHPFGAEVKFLDSCAMGDGERILPQLVFDALKSHDQGVMGTGPDWMDISSPIFTDSVQKSLRMFAETDDETNWHLESKKIIAGHANPWRRLLIDAEHLEDIMIDGSIETWVELVTDPAVISGHQLFVRSAWEGAKIYVSAQSEEAERIAGHLREINEKRLDADFLFRNSEGLYIQHPLDSPLSGIDN